MAQIPPNLLERGLTEQQVLKTRELEGDNLLRLKTTNPLWMLLKSVLTEPMILILLAASAIYFFTGNPGDGVFLSLAVLLVGAISFFQDSRSRKALDKLREFASPASRVIRDGSVREIPSADLVRGDLIMIEEGALIPADATILHSNDFSVNESILTGESMTVSRDANSAEKEVFQGTSVVGGLAIAEVTATGNRTKLARIGLSLAAIKPEPTPLEQQIGAFVKKMVLAGAFFFILVWVINYTRSGDVLESLLKALTLAMSILPEEIPVAFTTFMALGAWRLMKLGIVVKQMKTVETLGSASVICVDKTGTITQNKMALVNVYAFRGKQLFDLRDERQTMDRDQDQPSPLQELIASAMWASEPIPFDPMELAIHESYLKHSPTDERSSRHLVFEYPLAGKPPMMTHVFESEEGDRIIAAKGAPEALMAVSNLNEQDREEIAGILDGLAAQGFRVLGVGISHYPGRDYPKLQQDLPFTFLGLLAFYDPPKENIREVLNSFYDAGIKVKIITGDNALTTSAIAGQIGFWGAGKAINGDTANSMTDPELHKAVMENNIFTRMFPEAKLRLINALKAQGEVVAMTGDGVNDGPALRAAHIGIAMGKKGTEIAKQAASMILLDDDLAKMTEAVRMGRRIYTNLKKAVQYVISIHIPIILIVFIPLLLGWIYPSIFSPVHVIFLELVMGPTCSIIYENEPVEKNTMQQPPRPLSTTFFRMRELITSLVQGLAITAGLLLVYRYSADSFNSELITRTMVFTTLISANIFLTLSNRSFYYSILTTLSYQNKLLGMILALTILITLALIYIPACAAFFGFRDLSLHQIGISVMAGFLSVIWFELVKWQNRKNTYNLTKQLSTSQYK